jgi:DNA invertase Pin-like site-specific DNA recombinase
MERPALQRVLGDINQGLIDVVVVYKVDRLTRSLADFAKMVEVFDAHRVSFVATKLRPPNAKGYGWAVSFHWDMTSAAVAL